MPSFISLKKLFGKKILLFFFSSLFRLHQRPHRREPSEQARPGHHRGPGRGIRQSGGDIPALPGQRRRGREADGDAREAAGEAVAVAFVVFASLFHYLFSSLFRAPDLGEASLLGSLFFEGLEGGSFLLLLLFFEGGGWGVGARGVAEFWRVSFGERSEVEKKRPNAFSPPFFRQFLLFQNLPHLPLLRLVGEVVVVEVGLVGFRLLERLWGLNLALNPWERERRYFALSVFFLRPSTSAIKKRPPKASSLHLSPPSARVLVALQAFSR